MNVVVAKAAAWMKALKALRARTQPRSCALVEQSVGHYAIVDRAELVATEVQAV